VEFEIVEDGMRKKYQEKVEYVEKLEV